MSKGKTVLLDVIGSIVAYKTAGLASMLVRKGVKVRAPAMENATRFIDPITFEGLTGNKCPVDIFGRNFEFSVEHVALAKQAGVVMTAPASANVIGEIAHGITDDVLTTTVMACRYKKILTSAMSTNTCENPILQGSLDICGRYGMEVITPAWSYLACGDTRARKTLEPEVLYEYTLREAGYSGDLADRRILVTTGPTRESTDPMRYITNYSTGKIGHAAARVTAYRGADITLVSDPVNLNRPLFMETTPVESAREVFEAVTARSGERDIIVKAAVMADYRPSMVGTGKIKKSDGDLSTALERTGDILGQLGQNRRDGQFLCGFSMGTQNTLENSRAKLTKKRIDMIIANNLKVEGAGFGTNTNVVTLITRESETKLPIMPKEEVADHLLTEILKRTKGQEGSDPA